MRVAYESGDDVSVEIAGVICNLAADDFGRRLSTAARELGLIDELPTADFIADLRDLAIDAALDVPRSGLGAAAAARPDVAVIIYWLRKLVFRSAWVDGGIASRLIDVDFQPGAGTFRMRVAGRDVPAARRDDVPVFDPLTMADGVER